MLFKFGTFWKAAAVVLGAWVFFGIWDFEFTTITLLALILALKLQNR
jgi:multidrug efflux pump subunit AcrB